MQFERNVAERNVPERNVILEEGYLLRLQPYIHHVFAIYGTLEQQEALGKLKVKGNCYSVKVEQTTEKFKLIQDLFDKHIRDIVYLIVLNKGFEPSDDIIQFYLDGCHRIKVMFKPVGEDEGFDSVMDILRMRYPECGRQLVMKL